MSKKFYREGYRVIYPFGGKFFRVFDSHEANELVDLLNELFAYKLLVRKHKQDIEAIYGKSLRKQLKEVIE